MGSKSKWKHTSVIVRGIKTLWFNDHKVACHNWLYHLQQYLFVVHVWRNHLISKSCFWEHITSRLIFKNYLKSQTKSNILWRNDIPSKAYCRLHEGCSVFKTKSTQQRNVWCDPQTPTVLNCTGREMNQEIWTADFSDKDTRKACKSHKISIIGQIYCFC